MWHLLTNKHHSAAFSQAYHQQKILKTVCNIFSVDDFPAQFSYFWRREQPQKLSQLKEVLFLVTKRSSESINYLSITTKTGSNIALEFHLLCLPLRPSCLHCTWLQAEAAEFHYLGEGRGDPYSLDVAYTFISLS